jgi:hypothetical protein
MDFVILYGSTEWNMKYNAVLLKTYLSTTATLSIFVRQIFQHNICCFAIILDDGGYGLCRQEYSEEKKHNTWTVLIQSTVL